MAIYHFSAKVISRSCGSSAVAAAAYRSASRLHDQRLDRSHDFTNKAGVVRSEVMLPEDANEAWLNRERLWNDVEAAELRKDAQLAREIEFAIPRELDQAEGVALARSFVAREFVARGMVADLNVHWDIGADGLTKPHAHVMLAMREVTVGEVGEAGFGAKVREWNRTDLLTHWREAWGTHVNARLAELDIDARIDHRTLEAQGIALEPQHKIGPAAARMAAQGHDSERLIEHHAIARANGEKILDDPTIALDAITHQQSTFTARDLAMFVHRHSEDKEQFDRVLGAVRGSPELVKLGRDGRGDERFTSRAMLETEKRLENASVRLDARRTHGLAMQREVKLAGRASGLIHRPASGGLSLSEEQKTALDHITRPGDLAIVVGYAGTGKSAMLGVAREAWEASDYDVRGIALSGIAAENLEIGSGIASRTIASLEHQWSQGRDLLTERTILVVDEAGMIGTRQMERIVAEAERRRAKLVLVGDPEQLQAIEAGAAFRSIAERHGAVEITQVRRQREDWQRDATRQLATGRTGQAIDAYAQAGHVHAAPTREAARGHLIDRWDRERQAHPGASRIILTHTNDEVRALNESARTRMRAAGELGRDIALDVERGSRSFATGDRVMFLRNERSLGVKNGTLGSIEQVSTARMAVLLDDGRSVAFDIRDYTAIDHGYAATIHKAQGMTVDRVHVLASPGLDRHGAYVALSRHRDRVDLHYGEDDFASREKLVATLGRDRARDMASDYAPAPEQTISQTRHTPSQDLRREPAREPAPPQNIERKHEPTITSLEPAVQRHGRIIAAMRFSHSIGNDYTAEQRAELAASRAGLDALLPHAARDLEAAMSADPQLIQQAAGGRTQAALRAMQLETEMRADPSLRADVFVQRWQKLERQRREKMRYQETSAVNRIGDRMIGMAKGLERDPQLESLLRQRKAQLGLPDMPSRSVGQSLADLIGRGRNRGIGIGM